MLSICTDILPNTLLSYLAFRVSFLETLERIVLARQVQDEHHVFGYLTEVPFLAQVAPQVQLDLLAETWHRHTARRRFAATLVDESVVYSVFETAARIAEDDSALVERCLACGPRAGQFVADEYLPSALRNLHLSLSNEGDFLLISQFEDMHPDEARQLRHQFGIDEARIRPMFDALARWSISRNFTKNLYGLFSKREIARAASILGFQTIEQ